MDSIVNLREEMPFSDSKSLFSGELDFKTFPFLVKDHYAPTLEQAKEFMDVVREHVQAGKNLLVHCLHGHGRTSTFSVLAKIAMGWSFPKAYNDELDRFHYSFKHKAQDSWLFENYRELEVWK